MKVVSAMGGALAGIAGLAFTLAVLSTSLGVVREYCLDVPVTQASHRVVVDKHWTYVLWSPGPWASQDPLGRCVRNSPLRQALDAVGIWKLQSPEQQVQTHVLSQLRGGQREAFLAVVGLDNEQSSQTTAVAPGAADPEQSDRAALAALINSFPGSERDGASALHQLALARQAAGNGDMGTFATEVNSANQSAARVVAEVEAEPARD